MGLIRFLQDSQRNKMLKTIEKAHAPAVRAADMEAGDQAIRRLQGQGREHAARGRAIAREIKAGVTHPPRGESSAAATGEGRQVSADVVSQLDRLGDLHATGVLSEAEFAAAKAKVLAS